MLEDAKAKLEEKKAKLVAAKTNAQAAVKLKWEQMKIKEKYAKLKILQTAAKDDPNLKKMADKVKKALDDYSDTVDTCYKKVRAFPLWEAGKKECVRFVNGFAKELDEIKAAHAQYKTAKKAVKNQLEDHDTVGILADIYIWLLDDHQILKSLQSVAEGLLEIAAHLK